MPSSRRSLLLAAAIFTAALPVAAEPEERPSKAEKLMLPKLQLNQTTVGEAAEYLTSVSKKLDPAKTGVTITCMPGGGAIRVDLKVANTSVLDAVKQIATGANLDLTIKGDTLILSPKAGAKPAPPLEPAPPPAIPGLPGLTPAK
jgi:hypothetical protein